LEHEVANTEHVNETGDQAKEIIVENNMNVVIRKASQHQFSIKPYPLRV